MGKRQVMSIERRLLIWRDGITWNFDVRMKVSGPKFTELTTGHGSVSWSGITEDEAKRMIAEMFGVPVADVEVVDPSKNYSAIVADGATELERLRRLPLEVAAESFARPLSTRELMKAQGLNPDAPLSPETKAKLKQLERYRRRGVKRRG